mmetsp:Transcript_68698/g.210683  ORF Transcript_68698/g.210683 Transcript_68698/m.210683 type:complete len:363 (+) Transcript_68698:189-1277(+)
MLEHLLPVRLALRAGLHVLRQVLHAVHRRPLGDGLPHPELLVLQGVHNRRVAGLVGRLLRGIDRGRRPLRDAAGQLLHVGVDLVRVQGLVDGADGFGLLRAVVVRRQNDLQRLREAHHADEAGHAPGARVDAHGHLRLLEHGLPLRRVAHVHGERKLLAAGAAGARDLRHGHLGQLGQTDAQRGHVDQRVLLARKASRGQLHGEVVGVVMPQPNGFVGRLEDDDLGGGLLLELPAQLVHLLDEERVDEVGGRLVECHPEDAVRRRVERECLQARQAAICEDGTVFFLGMRCRELEQQRLVLFLAALAALGARALGNGALGRRRDKGEANHGERQRPLHAGFAGSNLALDSLWGHCTACATMP